MRLVHFIETGAVVGGIERYLQTLIGCPGSGLDHVMVVNTREGLALGGAWPVHVARWRAGAWRDPEDGARLRTLLAGVDGLAIFHAVPESGALDAWRLERGPAAVFCHDQSWWCASASRYHSRLDRSCGIRASTFRCAVRYHALGCGQMRLGPLLRGIERASAGRRALGEAGAILVASNYMGNEAKRHGARSERTHLVPLPTSFAGLDPPPDAGLPATVLCAARLTPLKGIGLLLAAFSMMRQQARLVIAGSGISERKIASTVRSHPMRERIELVGHLGSAEIREAMGRATVVVVPTVQPEAFGLVGIEALAMGRPVVATQVGGMSDWARPELGALLVPSPDARLMAAAIDRALTEDCWRTRAREQGAAWVAERHSVAAHVSALKAALGPLIR